MKIFSRLFVAACLITACLAPIWAQEEGPRAFKVVVNEANPTDSLDKSSISKIFLKKTSRWENRVRVLPVDLPAQSPVRDAFSEDVLDKSVSAIKSYWQRMIFSGRDVPPPEVQTGAAVLQFVAANEGAIGYVAAETELIPGTEELEVTE